MRMVWLGIDGPVDVHVVHVWMRDVGGWVGLLHDAHPAHHQMARGVDERECPLA
jgi:hypothetical protein